MIKKHFKTFLVLTILQFKPKLQPDDSACFPLGGNISFSLQSKFVFPGYDENYFV